MADCRVLPRLAFALCLVVTSSSAVAAPGGKAKLSIGGSTIDLTIEAGGGERPTRAEIQTWVERAATAVTAFYGRFPVPDVRIVVSRIDGRGISGTQYGGRLIRLRLGTEVPSEKLVSDWTATHEIFHLGFPDVDDQHLWMEEGMATYFEPIARARAGLMTTKQH
jgi:hypothetical protein